MSNIGKSTVTLMLALVLSKVIGFLRELVLASAYGTTIYSDAYLMASNIPTIIFAIIGSALATTFIPLYYESKSLQENGDSNKFINNIFNIVLLSGMIISIFIFIFTEPIVKIFALGFEGEILNITINSTKIIIFSIVFMGISAIMTSFLQINNNFIIPGVISILSNIIIIIAIVISMKTNYYLLTVGTLIGISTQFLIQLPFAYKNGYRYRIYLNLKEPYIKKMIYLVAPMLIGVAVNQINTMIDRNLASTLAHGSISALNYANKINGFAMGVFITSVGGVIYPLISKYSSEEKTEEFINIIKTSIIYIILLILPSTVGLITLAKPIVKFMFERGSFDNNATNMTYIALIFYSFGLIGYGLREILSKVFYSLQDTKTPMINGVISVILNIILNIILVNFMGHAGLAFATSISALLCIILLLNSLKKKIGYFGQDIILKTTLKSLTSSIVMGLVTYFVYSILVNLLGVGFIQDALALFGSIAIGVIVYVLLIIILKVEEVRIITDKIKRIKVIKES